MASVKNCNKRILASKDITHGLFHKNSRNTVNNINIINIIAKNLWVNFCNTLENCESLTQEIFPCLW